MWWCGFVLFFNSSIKRYSCLFTYSVCRWQEESSPTWTIFVMWIVVMSTPWCVTCAMSSIRPHVCWTAITSSVPAVYAAGPMTAVSAAPSVGKTLHCDVDQDLFNLHIQQKSEISRQHKHYIRFLQKSTKIAKKIRSFWTRNWWWTQCFGVCLRLSDPGYHTCGTKP